MASALDDEQPTSYLIGIHLTGEGDTISTRVERDMQKLRARLDFSVEEIGLIFSSTDGRLFLFFVRTIGSAPFLMREIDESKALDRRDQIFIAALADTNFSTLSVRNINRLQNWLSGTEG